MSGKEDRKFLKFASFRNIAGFISEDEVKGDRYQGEASLGKYRIIEKLGHGGSGTVYKAYDTNLRAIVALKLLDNAGSDDVKKRFRMEAEILAGLRHPNIVPVHETGDIGGIPYISLQYVEGKELEEMLLDLDMHELVRIFIDVCSALELIHENGIIHRDIKPANVIVGKQNRVSLIDFGISKSFDHSLTQTGEMFGTPHYMSPEQLRGELVDGCSDIYSLGVTMYRCLTMKLPFEGKTAVEVAARILDGDFTPPSSHLPGMDRGLESIVTRCICAEPKDRYNNIAELRRDLEGWLEGKAPPRRRYWVAILTSALIISCASLLMVLWDLIDVTGNPPLIVASRKEATKYYVKGIELLNIIKTGRLASVRRQFKNYSDDAVKNFGIAIDHDPLYAEAYLARGEVYYRSDRATNAVSDFTKAINLNPDISDAYFFRILANYREVVMGVAEHLVISEERVEMSMQDLGRMKTLGPESAKVRCAEAMVNHMRNMHDPEVKNWLVDSLGAVDAAISESPTLFVAHYLKLVFRHVLFVHAGLQEEKRKAFVLETERLAEKCIEMEPNFLFTYYYVAPLLTYRKKYAKALELIAVMKYLTDDPLVNLLEADIYWKTGDEAMLAGALKKVRADGLLPSLRSLAILVGRGRLWLLLGEEESAEADFKRAIDLAPEEKKEYVRGWISRIRNSVDR